MEDITDGLYVERAVDTEMTMIESYVKLTSVHEDSPEEDKEDWKRKDEAYLQRYRKACKDMRAWKELMDQAVDTRMSKKRAAELRDAAKKVAARRAKVGSQTARDDQARPTAGAQAVERVAARRDTGFHTVGESSGRKAREVPTVVEGCRVSHATSRGDPAVEDLEQVDLRGARVLARNVVPSGGCGGD